MTARLPLLLALIAAPDALAQPAADYLAALRHDYPNLLYNPGMDVPGWFQPTQADFWQDRPNLRDEAEKHSGTASLRIQGPGTGYSFQSISLALLPKTEYRLTAWIKTRDVKGKGVTLAFLPVAKGTAPPPVTGSRDWSKIEQVFTTTDSPKPGQLRITWDLKDGDTAWLDDVRLEPTSGQVPTAPKPTITPPGGTPRGGLTVTMTTEVPGAEIRYTVDGSDPHFLSTLYRGPFWLPDRVTLKARVFHAGHRDGEIASADFDLQPEMGKGVPLSPIDWSKPVDAWWASHVLNPKSTAWDGKVVSPEPRINVADVRDKHPASKTAGIAEALMMLPEAGGTLFFPKDRGPYTITAPEQKELHYYFAQGAVLLKRGHVHFISDGATVSCPWPVLGVASMEAGGKTFLQPLRDFYFRGLTFDGLDKSDIAVNFSHANDVLFEDCSFVNYVPVRAKTEGQAAPPLSWSGHPAPVVATCMTDNIWLRRCTITGGMWGVYFDGVHNGGFVGCKFPGKYRSGPILIMTNNDLAPHSPTTRNAQYIVIADCDFSGGGRAAATLSNSHTLLIGNRVTGLDTLLDMQGRPRSNVERAVAYEFFDNQLRENTLNGVKVLSSWNYPCQSFGKRPPNLIVGNTATGLDVILMNDLKRDVPLHNVVIRENNLTGPEMPQVRLRREAVGLVRDVRVTGNLLRGKMRELVVDAAGKPIEADGVTVSENDINP